MKDLTIKKLYQRAPEYRSTFGPLNIHLKFILKYFEKNTNWQ